MKKKKIRKKEDVVRIALDLSPEIIGVLDDLAVRFGSTRKRQAERLLSVKAELMKKELPSYGGDKQWIYKD